MNFLDLKLHYLHLSDAAVFWCHKTCSVCFPSAQTLHCCGSSFQAPCSLQLCENDEWLSKQILRNLLRVIESAVHRVGQEARSTTMFKTMSRYTREKSTKPKLLKLKIMQAKRRSGCSHCKKGLFFQTSRAMPAMLNGHCSMEKAQPRSRWQRCKDEDQQSSDMAWSDMEAKVKLYNWLSHIHTTRVFRLFLYTVFQFRENRRSLGWFTRWRHWLGVLSHCQAVSWSLPSLVVRGKQTLQILHRQRIQKPDRKS